MEGKYRKVVNVMGRHKNLPLDEQIIQKEAKINELSKTLENEKAELDGLKKQKELADLERLKKAIDGSAMSFDDVIAYVEGKK